MGEDGGLDWCKFVPCASLVQTASWALFHYIPRILPCLALLLSGTHKYSFGPINAIEGLLDDVESPRQAIPQ